MTADTGSVSLSAVENATIRAMVDSAASASGGSAYGTGSVLAMNGTIATNLVLSQANAFIRNSEITTSGAAGDVVVDAKIPRISMRPSRVRPHPGIPRLESRWHSTRLAGRGRMCCSMRSMP